MPAEWERRRDCTIPALLERLAQERGGEEALVYPFRGLRLTFQELDARTLQAARAFLALGVRAGDRVTVWAENVPEWVVLQLALARIGAILVTANTALKAPEIEYLLGQSESSAVCYTAGAEGRFVDALARIRSRLPLLRHEIFLGETAEPPARSYREFLGGAAAVLPEAVLDAERRLDPDDVINMQYTSGTTGFPKGVMLTHKNLVNNAWGLGTCLRYRPGERLALTVPLFHCFGCVVGTLGAYVSAVTICAIDQFDPVLALRLVERERCNILYGVPTHYRLLVEAQEKHGFDLTSLRTAIMGGAPCPRELVRRIVTDLHLPQATAAYGLTECSPGVSINDPDDDLELRSATVGKPLADIEIRIVDPASGAEQPPGFQGELQVRGHCVMKGYYNKPEETAQVLSADGWLRTGDLAVLGQDGYLRIVGRLKEMIIRGGENVYPAEVEEAIRGHQGIADVAVFGVPHSLLGEDVHAALLLVEGAVLDEPALRAQLQERLAGAKIPSRFHVVASFPLTASGKVQKFRLAEQFTPREGA